MHIPKTGGTTLRHIFLNNFNKKDIFPNQQQLKHQFNGSYPSEKIFCDIVNSIPLQKKVACGHYPIDIKSKLPENFKIITIVRNPLNRFISHLNHLNRTNNYKDVNHYFNQNWIHILRTQSNFFSFTPEKPNWKEVEKNIKQIEVIGIFEHFNQSINLINKAFNLSLSTVYKIKNASSSHFTYNNLTKENQKELIRHLADEIRLYNKCFVKYSQQINKFNIT